MKNKNSKKETSALHKVLQTASIVFLGIILLISLFASLPTAKTQAGQNILNQASKFIIANSSQFFLLILILSFLCFTCYAIRFLIFKTANESLAKNAKDNQKKIIDNITQECEDLSSSIQDLRVSMASEIPTNLRIAEQHSSQIKNTLVEMKSTYKDNLRNYSDSNKKIYKIVQKTQLASIENIKELTETYCKL